MNKLIIAGAVGVSILLALSTQSPSNAQDNTVGKKWQPHIDLEGKPGTKRSLAETDLFLPLWQDEDSLLFASFRARMDDSDSREGNFGLGLREMFDNGWNLGGYGYLDHRKSPYGNSFNQATLGLEALSFDLDLRANVYLPFGRTAHLTDEFAEADFSGANIQYRAGYERAMKGFDAEIGWRVPVFEDDANQQLRIYGGGYRFTDDYAKTVQGPRGRIDLTFDETPYLWAGSRLSIGAEIQHDSPRGTQSFGLLRLRIPLQNFDEKPKRPRLSAMERRMADPIIRDIDIVSQAGAFGAPEKITATADGNDVLLLSDTQHDGNSIDDQIAGAATNATIVLSGVFNDAFTAITLNDGQTVMGKGEIQVKTPSGRTVTIQTPGATVNANPGLVGTRATAFVMANNSRLIGMNINITKTGTGVQTVGVQASGKSNVEIIGNTINSTSNDDESAGIWIRNGSSNVKIRNNTINAKVTTAASAATYGLLVGRAGEPGSTISAFDNNAVTISNGSTNNLVGYINATSNNIVSGSNNTGNTTQCSGNAQSGSISFTNGTSC
ncbi:hypothetical protein MACH10_19760 [Thalassospira tepidiphila]|uniref:inverse autotransporter beta domain-containing protein n=1 Tax=Thalassospira tepidiphila TaxID=393657 RepID=UPI00291DBC36|nr:hypothetical protein MACH10_19760 [Thalassospira tepidiphila]